MGLCPPPRASPCSLVGRLCLLGFVVRPPSPPAPLAWLSAVPPGLCAGRHPLCSFAPLAPKPPPTWLHPPSRAPGAFVALESTALGACFGGSCRWRRGVCRCRVRCAGAWWLLCGWHPPPPLGGMHAQEGARQPAGVLPVLGPPAASRVCICVRHGERWWVPGGWGGAHHVDMHPPPHMPTWDGVGRGGAGGLGRPGRAAGAALTCQHRPASAQHPIRTVLSVRCVTHPQPQGEGPGGRAAPTLWRRSRPRPLRGSSHPRTAHPARSWRSTPPRHCSRFLCGCKCTCPARRLVHHTRRLTGVGPGGGVLRCMGAQRGPVLPLLPSPVVQAWPGTSAPAMLSSAVVRYVMCVRYLCCRP